MEIRIYESTTTKELISVNKDASHRIGGRPWKSCGQPTLFETFSQVLENKS